MEFIIAQVLGFISLVIMVICVQFKQKSKIVIFNTMANFINAAQYFLLGALTGGIISLLNALRCIVFYFYTRKGLKPSLIVLIIFEITAVVSGAIGWQSWWSIVPIIASVLFTYALWQENIIVIKIFSGVAGLSWSIYDIVVKAFMGAIQQFAQFVSAMIAIILLKRKPKNAVISENVEATERIEENTAESTDSDQVDEVSRTSQTD